MADNPNSSHVSFRNSSLFHSIPYFQVAVKVSDLFYAATAAIFLQHRLPEIS